ncbi:MAG: retron Ec67 family RNA-directed DNA polymerase/endonuclease [Waterburya sp.]
MSVLKKLKNATTIADVADILRFKTKKLAYILYVQSDLLKYKEFDIPKKSGGVRHIVAPQGGLKLLQRRLADVLQECLDEINNAADGNEAKSIGQISHGFRRKLSIRTNAKKHRNRRYVFNIDLIDFFGSINFGRVRGFFIKDEQFCLNPNIATILAQIACFKNSLPQGSPCSPVISNLIGNILDMHLVRLAARTGCIYTRYADDLTFSTNKRCFPQSIAIQSDDDNHAWIPGAKLLRLVKHSGFQINSKKTRMQYRCSRQEVTGLVVNRKVNIRREYRHNVRAMVHNLCTKGSFFLPTYEKDANGDYSLEIKPGNLNQLHGRLGFIDGIDRHNIEMLSTSKEAQIKSKETIYRRFLFYKEFYAASNPVLICEGWTDYIYVENALRKLASNYPSLVSLDSNEKVTFLIKRFKYSRKDSKSHTAEILGIKGGVGDFINFINSYKREFGRFSVSGMKEPVILLIDNDDGGKKVLNCVCSMLRLDIKEMRKAPYIHIHRNLYLIPTPLQENQKESQIEDLFDASTLEVKIDGKSFNRSDEKATETTYSKAVFARKVVKEMASSISFEGFVPLLDRIAKVIESHYAQRKR